MSAPRTRRLKTGHRGVEVKRRAQSTSVPKTVSWKGCGGRARLRRATARHELLSELIHLRHIKFSSAVVWIVRMRVFKLH